jgi:hypothetical protein
MEALATKMRRMADAFARERLAWHYWGSGARPNGNGRHFDDRNDAEDVGDSPLTGAGAYANSESCAISATRVGEFFIRYVVAE